MPNLPDSMRRLVHDMGMLTGLTVCYGTRERSCTHTVGLAREVRLQGEAFITAEQPLTSRSVYDLASLTKLFTAVAVLQLVDAGKLDLHDDMGERDDRFPMLRHTSILDVMTYQAMLRSQERIDLQPDVEAAQAQVFTTGRYHGPEPPKLYSDMNALVLKYLVERISGKSFYQFLSEHVLQPCGMRETWRQVPAQRVVDCVDYNLEHKVVQGQYRLQSDLLSGQPHDPKARLLGEGGRNLCGHAGLFSTAQDMVLFAQGLLSGALLKRSTLMHMGRNRTGRLGPPYRQYLGLLVFSKSEDQRLSEVPAWMGPRAFAVSGYTGNHFALDPELGVFDIFLGNRCHNRVTTVLPEGDAQSLGLNTEGVGRVSWPDGRQVRSSHRYYYQKDDLLHGPVHEELKRLGWVDQ